MCSDIFYLSDSRYTVKIGQIGSINRIINVKVTALNRTYPRRTL